MKIKVLFTSNAVHKLNKIADYIYEKTQSKKLTRNYLKKLREFIASTLQNFPKAGRPAAEIYKSTRKLVYQSYSIMYSYDEEEHIVYILTLYRENLP